MELDLFRCVDHQAHESQFNSGCTEILNQSFLQIDVHSSLFVQLYVAYIILLIIIIESRGKAKPTNSIPGIGQGQSEIMTNFNFIELGTMGRLISLPIKQSQFSEYFTRVESTMFNLCKTVKIYHTVNHYSLHKGPEDPHEIQIQEVPDSPPSSSQSHPNIRMVQSHSLSPKKSRTGINISLKDSSLSPSKTSTVTRDRPDFSKTHNRQSSNSPSHSSDISSLRLQHYHRIIRETPAIVQSKITYAQMSQRPKSRESTEEVSSPKAMQESLPSQVPLIKLITGNTMESSQGSDKKKEGNSNPLKKSTSFLRSSHSKMDQSIKQSGEHSMYNSIDFKFSTSKSRRQDCSDSLLRLSCSSYTDILNTKRGFEDFSQACSLELKKDDSIFLKDYVCEVNESIIMEKEEKKLKEVKSNYDFFQNEDNSDFSEAHSIIIGKGRDSPIQKLKKRYGDNLLHPYDKDTILSKSFISRSHNETKSNHIIDESYIIEHQIYNEFSVVKGSEVNRENFRMFLAVQETAKLLVAIKEMSTSSIHQINKELSLYREIEGFNVDVSVSRLYQMYTHGSIFVLVKEPYEMTLLEYINRNARKFPLISWQFIIKNLEETLIKTIKVFESKGLHLTRLISVEEIVFIFGEWKLHTPDMFSQKEREGAELSQVLELLREEIMGRIGAARTESQLKN